MACRNSRVRSSEGKIAVVAPSSAPMLVMTARSGTESVAAPGPAYSKTRPTPPFTVSSPSRCRMMSLAEAKPVSAPVSTTRTTLGQGMTYASPAMARATERPPAPMAKLPTPPAVGVWESEPMSVAPGLAKFSRCNWWQMPSPGGEKTTP